MTKWIFLFFSCFSVYAAIETIRWFLLMLKATSNEVEKTMGYPTSGLSSAEREQRASSFKSRPYGPFFAVFVMCFIALVTVLVTIKAFMS